MKTVSTALLLATCICLRAELPAGLRGQGAAVLIPAHSGTPGEDMSHKEHVEQAWAQAREAADRAQRQARHTMDLARSKFAMAESDMAEPIELPVEDGFGFAIAGASRGGAQPLVIRGAEMDSNTVANVQEDLAVMSRILNKALEREVGREGRDSAMGIVLSALPGARRPQSIYLEGYGALFLLSVKFPLVAAPAKEEEKPEKAVDSTWEQTKREMYGNRAPNVKVWNVPSIDASAEYNSEQVEGLKKELIEAMKNASNIRDVKPTEWITVSVIGNRPGGRNQVKHVVTGQKGRTARAEAYVSDSGRSASRESTLTLRAKKADIDAYAKGSLDAEQFKKRVSVAAY